MENGPHLPYLREIVVFLVAAAIVVPVFQRLRLSPILGFLLAGVAIGPYGAGRFADDIGLLRYAVIWDVEGVKPLAEFGVVFLLFMVGLELSVDRLWAMRRLVFGLGTAQVVVTAAAIALITWALGADGAAALLIGASLALSSTAIVLQLLIERGQLASRMGRAAFSILLLQDLAVVPILLLAGLLSGQAQIGLGASLLQALLSAAAALLVITVIGRIIARPLFRLVAGHRQPEPFMAMALLAIIGTAAATAAVGLSMATGAFLAGLLLADTEFRHQIKVDVEPFKGLLLGLFFMSIGMGVDLAAVLDDLTWIATGVVGLLVVKALLIAVIALALGQKLSVALPLGILLAQGGEFAFVVIGTGRSAEVVAREIAQLAVVVTSLTMLLTPALAWAAEQLGRVLAERETDRALAPFDQFKDVEGHVIIAGYGRVGQVIARMLDAQGWPHAGLDLDGHRVSELRKRGVPVFYGDGRRREVLEAMGAARAAAIVITLDDPTAAEVAVASARQAWPDVPIYVRARDREHAERLIRLGATRVIPETSESSLQLAGLVLNGLGVPADAVSRLVLETRERDYGEPPPADAAAPRAKGGPG